MGALLLGLLLSKGPHLPPPCAWFGVGCPNSSVHGFSETGWERVAESLRKGLESGVELGGRATIYFRGKKVSDHWGGVSSVDSRAPWTESTMVTVFSSTKVTSALVVCMLADRGLIDLDAPISRYWPEFGVNGKEDLTVSELLRHDAGLLELEPTDLTLLTDHSSMRKLLARQRRILPKGTRAYHSLIRGEYENILVRIATGLSMGQAVAEWVSKPLGVEFYIGLPAEHSQRVANVTSGSPLHPLVKVLLPYYLGLLDDNFLSLFLNESSIVHMTKLLHEGKPLVQAPENFNLPVVQAVELPSANGITNAASVARIAAALANGGELDGVRLLSREGLQKAISDPITRYDQLVAMNTTFTAGGFAVMTGVGLDPSCASSFYGWAGWGGSLFIFSPEYNVGFGYTMNGMSADPIHPVAVDIFNNIICPNLKNLPTP